MNEIYYAGITKFVNYWANNSESSKTEMVQETYNALIREANAENDAVIDATKAMVECVCRILIEVLSPQKSEDKRLTSTRADPENLLSRAVELLGLGANRNTSFTNLVEKHHDATVALRDFRNIAGPLSHGRNGFLFSLSSHHRRGAVITADTIIFYLHEAYLNFRANAIFEKETYEHFEKDHKLIDGSVVFDVVDCDVENGFVDLEIQVPKEEKLMVSARLSEILFAADRKVYLQVLEAVRPVDEKDEK